jgi:hypothetical protein
MNTGSSTQTASFGSYYAGGGVPNTGSAFVDGAPVIVQQYHIIALIPTQDAVQEFRVQVNNVEPEFGMAANGVISFTTKSGTNAFHGAAYEFLRNRVLNANTFFGNRAGLSRPAFTQNQFGANIGGPIVRNKTFFFFSYEGFRLVSGSTTTLTLPTAAQRAGDFSNTRTASGALIPIYDPSASPRTPFVNNVIPASRLSNAAVLMAKQLWALPNGPGAAFTGANNFTVNAPLGGRHDQYNFRVDHNLSEKQRLFARYTHWNLYNDAFDPQGLGYTGPKPITTRSSVLGDSYTLNPTMILDATVSYIRHYNQAIVPKLGTDFTTIGWPAAYNSEVQYRLPPSLNVQGFSASVGGGNPKYFAASDDLGASGSITKILGRHTIKFGGEYRRMRGNWGEGTGVGGVNNGFSFTNLFTAANPLSPGSTGSAMASFMLGLGSSGAISNYTFVAMQEVVGGAYIGDTFRATNKLTVNLGLRWEYPGYWTERFDHATVWESNALNPAIQSLGLPYKGDIVLVNSPRYPGRHTKDPHFDLFQPRVGLAYRFTETTVVRAGFGTTLFPNDTFRDMSPLASPVNQAPTLWVPTLDGSQTAVTTLDNPFPNGINQPPYRSPSYESALLGRQVGSPIPSDPAGYVAQWNFGIEHQFGEGAMLGVAYLGSRGIHLPGGFRNAYLGTSLDQIPDQYLSLGSQLVQQVTNPFYGTVQTGALSGKTVPLGQLLVPYPQYNGVFSTTVAAYDSNYHSLQVKFQKRFHSGGTFLGSYAWSKTLGNSDNQSVFAENCCGTTAILATVQDFNDIRADRSLLTFEVAHRLVFSYVVDLPFGKGKRFLGGATGPLDKIVSGWGFDGIFSYQSGFPLPMQAQENTINTQFYGGDTRPNVVLGCDKSISGRAQARLTQWFNTACFTQPSQFAFGDESRTDPNLRSPGIANADGALFKNTLITERVGLQFRAEVFNMANRVQFGPPGTTLGTAQFGVVSAQRNNPRLIQLSLRLSF